MDLEVTFMIKKIFRIFLRILVLECMYLSFLMLQSDNSFS